MGTHVNKLPSSRGSFDTRVKEVVLVLLYLP